MYHIYRMYLTTMSARFFHSADLEGLRDGLTGSGDGPEARPGAGRTDEGRPGPKGRGFDRGPGARPRVT